MGVRDDDVVLYRLEKAEEQIQALEKELNETKENYEKRERQRLLWGIGTLGTIVSTLIGIIWSYRSEIFK